MQPDRRLDSDLSLAHALLRVGLGINLFMHGFSRILNLAAFVEHTRTMFAKTWLPLPVVTLTTYTIPFIELLLGAVLILGSFAPRACNRLSLYVHAHFRYLPGAELERRFGATGLHDRSRPAPGRRSLSSFRPNQSRLILRQKCRACVIKGAGRSQRQRLQLFAADTATSTVISRGLPVARCRSYADTRSSGRSGRSNELGRTLPGTGA
jgi:hypothetical protein